MNIYGVDIELLSLAKCYVPNFKRKSKAIAQPYDHTAKVYELILGPSMAYTCGNFDGQNISLEQAQKNKYAMHSAWLELYADDLRLLDVGAGWGGYLNSVSPYKALFKKGINLSFEQAQYSRDKFGIHQELVNWKNYQPLKKFNRLTSQGMPEHVGKKDLPKYFTWINSILEAGSISTLQFYSRDIRVPKIVDKFYFPCCYPPNLNEVHRYMKLAGLEITDVNVRSEDYARTIEEWLKNLLTHQYEIIELGETQEFINRLNILYCGCIESFRNGNSQLVQLRFVKGAV